MPSLVLHKRVPGLSAGVVSREWLAAQIETHLAANQPASALPVSRSVFRSLRMKLHPPPASRILPDTCAAVFGAPPSSWVTVNDVTPPCPGSISHVRRLKPSAAISGSQRA